MVKGWRIKAKTKEGNIILKSNMQDDKRVQIKISEHNTNIVEFILKPIDKDTRLIMSHPLTEGIKEKITEGITNSMKPCVINKDYDTEVLP